MVLSKLRKLRSFLSYFFAAKKKWAFPRKSEVLIFDAAGVDILMPYLSSWGPEVLHIRNEVVYMPVLLASFFRKGKRLVTYADCYIKYVQPKLVITHIDNNPNFYLLSGKHSGIVTVFLQNGLRSYYLDIFEMLDSRDFRNIEMHVDYMFTFGQAVGREYNKRINGRWIPVGSVKNNSIARRIGPRNKSIVFISQFRSDQWLTIDGAKITRKEYFEYADMAVVSFLDKYAKRTGRSFSIATYNMDTLATKQELEMEKQYYDSLVGSRMDYIVRESSVSSYQILDAAEVGVSIDSSLAYESAVRGNKTAFFCVRGEFLGKKGYDFGWPASFPGNGRFWTNNVNNDIFEDILENLFAMSDGDWLSELERCSFEQIMIFDKENEILKSKLNEILRLDNDI